MKKRATLTEFIQRPTPLLRCLVTSDLYITRRDESDLVVRLAANVENDEAILSGVFRMWDFMIATMPSPEDQTETMLRSIGHAFPWVAFLPDKYALEFVTGLSPLVQASASLGEYGQLHAYVNSWRDTAEIYADPERAALTAENIDSKDLIPAVDPREA